MSTISITIKETTNPAIIKFEADQFLTQHQSFEFHNIDEAKDSPLARQLFYLPFVKAVMISSNFIAVERFNIVEWKDVQDEVANQIKDFLNEGGTILNKEIPSTSKKPISIYAESTPNPSVMKFVSNKKLVITSCEFKNIEDAAGAPLAKALFHFPFVKELFFDENYISITKQEHLEWNEVVMELREFIKSYIQEGKEIITANFQQPNSNDETPAQSIPSNQIDLDNLDDTSKQIVAILDEYVKPAVASDGGNILFDSYDTETKIVKVVLQGACSGCPSSTITLKNGIENMLKEMLQDKVNEVVAVNG